MFLKATFYFLLNLTFTQFYIYIATFINCNLNEILFQSLKAGNMLIFLLHPAQTLLGTSFNFSCKRVYRQEFTVNFSILLKRVKRAVSKLLQAKIGVFERKTQSIRHIIVDNSFLIRSCRSYWAQFIKKLKENSEYII